jgi:hypothetical protein
MLPGLSFLSEWWELEVHISHAAHAAARPDVSFKIDHGPP